MFLCSAFCVLPPRLSLICCPSRPPLDAASKQEDAGADEATAKVSELEQEVQALKDQADKDKAALEEGEETIRTLRGQLKSRTESTSSTSSVGKSPRRSTSELPLLVCLCDV